MGEEISFENSEMWEDKKTTEMTMGLKCPLKIIFNDEVLGIYTIEQVRNFFRLMEKIINREIEAENK